MWYCNYWLECENTFMGKVSLSVLVDLILCMDGWLVRHESPKWFAHTEWRSLYSKQPKGFILQGCQKVFMTGQTTLNSKHYLIKYMGGWQYCSVLHIFLSVVMWAYSPIKVLKITPAFHLLLLLFAQCDTLWGCMWAVSNRVGCHPESKV